MAVDAHMTDKRAAQLLAALPEGNFIFKVKYSTGRVRMFEGKFDPMSGRKGVVLSRSFKKPGQES